MRGRAGVFDRFLKHVPRVLAALEVPSLVAVPCVLGLCAFFQVEQAALLTVVVVLVATAVFFASFEMSRPTLRQIMPTVVMAALAGAGRILFAPVPHFKPVSAVCILAGAVFGRQSGFLVGALAALVSNFFFGQGPWTPWQMYAWGLVGYLAGVLADRGWLERLPILCTYGFLSALLFGVLLNGWYVIGFVHPITPVTVALALGAALPFDVAHGVATVVFLLVLYAPWRKKLERIKRKYALVEEATGQRFVHDSMLTGTSKEQESRGFMESSLRKAHDALSRGEAVIFPTDTVYGLGVATCAADTPEVLYRLKERDRGKPVAWLVGSVDDLDRYGQDVSDLARLMARTFWPGALTLIVKASDQVPAAFCSAEGTVGLRMPDNQVVLDLIARVGCPLATTSANRSGAASPCSYEAIDPQLSAHVSVSVADVSDAEKSGLASTVLDCTREPLVVVRQGAITIDAIEALS